MYRKILSLILAVVVVAALMAVPAAAARKQLITIAAGWVLGVYYPLAGAMSRIVYTKLPGVRATVESSGASVANARLLAQGEVDFALLQNDIAYYAARGQRMFKKPVKNIRGITRLYPEFVQVAARAASGVTSIAGLKGKRVAIGPLGSGTEANARQILEAYGLSFKDLARAERLGASEASDFLQDGRIDAAFYTVGIGAAAIVDVAIQTPLRMVPIDGAPAAKLLATYPFYTIVSVPANTYKGIGKAVKTVAVLAMLATHTGVKDDLVYRFTKVIFENSDMLVKAHAQGRNVKLEQALEGMPITVHPGAARYFRERGVLK